MMGSNMHYGGWLALKVPDLKALKGLMDSVESSGGEVSAVWPHRETLEDLFLQEIQSGRTEAGR